MNPGETSHERPDLVARVFKKKLTDFLEVIIKGQIFGEIVAYFGAIEWQKRGLPHAHFLFTLAEEDVPRTPEDIDKMISAEMPKPNPDDPVQQKLHDLVKKFMVHGPCDLTSPCHQNDKKVRKNFLFHFSNLALRDTAIR